MKTLNIKALSSLNVVLLAQSGLRMATFFWISQLRPWGQRVMDNVAGPSNLHLDSYTDSS